MPLFKERHFSVPLQDTGNNQIDLLVTLIDQRRNQKLPAITEQTLQPPPGKHALRPPRNGEPQDRGIHRRVGKLLRHQRPYAEAPKRQHNAQRTGKQRAAQSRKEEALELHRLFDIGLLHVLQPRNNKRQPQHPQNRRQPGFPEHRRKPRRQQKQCQIQKQAEKDIKIKDR